ncbi:MAG: rhomboid family intramembrane serine protease [Victivallaceae bacterium]|nr:rhomboid family intramembrane serine protease [Victivallaceae bacterium]
MGLFDRGYMHQPQNNYDGRSGGSADDWRGAALFLIGINTMLFLAGAVGFDLDGLALSAEGIRHFQIWQVVTAAFLHADFWHIFFNMYGLWLFGNLVGPHIGAIRFAWLYIIGAVIGNLCFLAFNWDSPSSIIGASGAVCAIMAAAAMLEPDRRFAMIFMPFMPLKTRTLVIAYTVLEALLQLGGSADGIAHLAHLGGFLGGYIFIRLLFGSRAPWDPLRFGNRGGKPRSPFDGFVSDWNRNPAGSKSKSNTNATSAADPDRPVGSHELDTLLDKISRHGINSLSEYELSRLRRAREEMRGQR